MLVAIPLSLLIYGVKPIKETIMPVVSFLRYVPVTAFSPLLILWFGIGEQMKISFLFIATFVYLLPSILLCFNDVPQDLMDTGKTIGMTSWETIKEILLPASLPSIFSTFLMMRLRRARRSSPASWTWQRLGSLTCPMQPKTAMRTSCSLPQPLRA